MTSTPRLAHSKSSGPLYLAVAETITQWIAERELPPGHRLEPEPVLAKTLGVSRITLRRALELLEEAQLIVRHHGIGTFVATRKVTYPLVGLHSTREIAGAHGFAIEVEIVGLEATKPTEAEQEKLQLSARERVVRFFRVDSLDGVPIGAAKISLPARLAGKFTEEEFAAHSTYDLLESRLGLRVGSAQQVLRAAACPRAVAELLRIKTGAPVFLLDRLTFESSGAPLDWGRVFYRHDVIEFSVELNRQSSGRSETPMAMRIAYPVGRPAPGAGA
jgi:GntR family transcriptional regulator